MKILAIAGSLRKNSTNKTLLKAAILLAPPGIEITLWEGLGELPHFNPDLEANEPARVKEFKDRVGRVDGLVISSPEYMMAVPGSLKNALDWLVGSGEIVGKPVALFNAASRAFHAQESLRQILTLMSARVVPEAYLEAPLLGKALTVEEVAAHPVISKNVQKVLAALAGVIRSGRLGS
jgi:chromate reductase, NAD(P)H dehydrogenase (quinone)